MNDKHKELLYQIEEYGYYENYETIKGYDKDRCPLCLTYKCIICNKTSTFFNANCCRTQLTIGCAEDNISFKEYYCIFKFVIFFPIIRVAYIANIIHFQFFRALTRENKLLQRKEKIKEMIDNNYTSDVIFGTYQSKFRGIPMFIISLLTIIGSICWALPFALYYELYLILEMFLYLFSINDKFKRRMNLLYLLAFVPGLRRNKFGEIKKFLI